MKESDIQREIMAYLQSLPNAFVFKAAAGPYARIGLPDVMAVIDGRPFAFEVKRPGGKATVLQKATIGKMLQAGAIAHVVYSRSEVEKIVMEGLIR